MDTDKKAPDIQGGTNTVFLFKQETHNIIGCAFEVLNELGPGLNQDCSCKKHLCSFVSICG